MSIADILRQSEPEESDKPEPVELVTIPDTIDHGVGLGNPLPFPDVASALDYANKLPPDDRDVCFILTSEGAMTLAQAEGKQSTTSEIGAGPTEKTADPLQTK
jgi:hypothetical protein